MKAMTKLVCTLGLLTGAVASAQQSADEEYRPAIAQYAPQGERPSIVIDEAHDNFHRLEGRFGPFGVLAEHGGFAVASSTAPFSSETLDMDILVIANAASAPAPEEVDAVVTWVSQGGSLLLIADHAPFGEPAIALAARFGVGMGNGYVVAGKRSQANGIITFREGGLGWHPILEGKSDDRKVRQVVSFLGQSLTAPEGAAILLHLPSSAVELPNREAIAQYRQGEGQPLDVGDRAQAIALTFGEGRVVVSGEAAMLTSQVANGMHIGVGAADNEAYALNVLDWLAHRAD